MKIKLVIDFSNKESLEAVDFLKEYIKTHPDLSVDIHGYDLDDNNEFNKAYYALYTANKYGVGLDYVHQILNDYYEKGLDINNVSVLADAYKAIGYNKNDMIDAIVDGEFEHMHEYLQNRYHGENYCDHCNILVYDDEKHVFNNTKNMIDYLNNK